MDTSTVAARLGTTPRRLRQFLRSEGSTFQAVGSGARYDFTERDLPALNDRFHTWNGSKAVKMTVVVPVRRADDDVDRQVWHEEEKERGGPLELDDIRRPEVRARVRAIARQQEARLNAQLLACGLHITQMRVRAS